MKTKILNLSDQKYFKENFEKGCKEGTGNSLKKDYITICGINVRTMKLFNKETKVYYLTEQEVDIMLLNECNMGK